MLAEGMHGGELARVRLHEAMTTSDFPMLFGDILDRMLLGSYSEAPYSWNFIVKRRTVRDFRTVKRLTLDGAEAVLDKVPEASEYPAAKLVEGDYEYRVYKYGRKIDFTFEDMINDDIEALKDIPDRFGKAARRSEERFVTSLFVDANGPLSTFFTSGNKNIITGNPVLSIEGLQAGMKQLGAMVDADGEPIFVAGATLWVPPALEIPALNILNATSINLQSSGGGTAGQHVITQNWMSGRLKLAVGYYIPLLASAAHGDTMWAIFGDPDQGRPAGEIGFLRGHETPEIRIKSSNSVMPGGGPIDPLEGDFDTDDVQYRVRHIYGGVQMDPKAAVASNGSGS